MQDITMLDKAPKCGHCREFCVIADAYTPFGDYENIEPPNEVILCAACTEELEIHYIKYAYVTNHWEKAECGRRMAKRLGLVEAGPRGAAWSVWINQNKLPNNWTIWEQADN